MEIGETYLFMTLTYYWTGRVVAISPAEVLIDDAAQVFDTGELENCLTKWEVALCQVVPSGVIVSVPRSGTTTITWSGPLPRKTKRST